MLNRSHDKRIETPLSNHRLLRQLTPTRRCYHFFSMASFNISAFRRSSAYIFLRRLFSASSSFKRDIIDASIPPYLAVCKFRFFHAESPVHRLRENSTFGISYFSGGLPKWIPHTNNLTQKSIIITKYIQ